MLNIITAFKSEATPIIECLSLKLDPEPGDYPIYIGAGVCLGIGGLGFRNAQKLTRYMIDRFFQENNPGPTCWLNFGVAGSADWDVGDLVVADKVIDYSSATCWNLEVPVDLDLPKVNIFSVKTPQTRYEGNHVYDMEAAAIMSCLTESMSAFKIIILKLVSDGPTLPLNELTKSSVRQLIQARKKDIISKVQTISSFVLEDAEKINPENYKT